SYFIPSTAEISSNLYEPFPISLPSSTNGEIIHSKEYKRIVWDSTFQELKFTMFSNELNGSQYKPLAPYYENKKK
ncbi:MAG: hypothetical protein P4L45_17010, partial [Ignavibacteriaceae bacterium]|nr:hypothetical protein [Ignavibacteriaceae bacterium]